MKKKVRFKSIPGVYKITCLGNKKIYIGSTRNISKRRQDHFCRMRGNYHENSRVQRSFNKYGELSFKFEVLEYAIGDYDEDYILSREQYYLDTLKPYIKEIGFNFSKKASLCWNRVPASGETRQKQREAKLKNPTKYWLGKKHSEETKQKISKVQIGRKLSKKTKRKMKEAYLKNVKMGVKMFKTTPIKIIDPFGKVLDIENTAKFCRENSLSLSCLRRVASGERNSHKGYTRYEEEN